MAHLLPKLLIICLFLTLIFAQDNSTNSTGPPPPPPNDTNGTNGTAPPPNNMTNSTNGTAPPPNNTTNSTNGTAPPPPNNVTNTTNGTAPPPPNNSTNSTGPANMTFAPPPPIGVKVVATLNISQVDSRLIQSKRIQALQLEAIPANATANASTAFRLSYYNRNAPNNVNVYDLNLPGDWTYVTGTKDTLSCSVIHETGQDIYGLLQFISATGTFKLLARNFLSYFTNQSPVNVSTVAAGLIVRENCDGVYYNNVLYKLIPGTNNITTVTVPAGWTPRSSSESLKYGVASNILYRFDPLNSTFTSIQNLPSHQTYGIRSWKGRVVVAGANSTNATNNMTQISQRFFVFNDALPSLSLVGQFDVSGVFPQPMPLIPYMTSPQLTKIGVSVPSNGNGSAPANNSNSSGPSVLVVLKSIDYVASSIGPLTFQEPNRFQATVRNLRPDNMDYVFGDNYYVVRNASAGNNTGMNGTNGTNGTQPNVSFVEEAYQFVGNQVVYLRNRMLDGRELTDFRRIWIDTSYTNQLVVLNAFAVPAGVEINQFVYGSLSSINKVVPPATPAFITFPVPPYTSKFIPMDALGWVYVNSNGSSSNVMIVSGDYNATNHTKVISGEVMGNAKILAMSSSCFIFVDANNNTLTVASERPDNATGQAPPPNNTNATNGTNGTNGPFLFEDITPLVANLSVTNQSRWTVSEKCDRFAVNGNVFFRGPNQTRFAPGTNNASFNPSAIDQEASAALVGNSIWLLNPDTNSFFKAFENPQPILPNSSISVFDRQIVVTGVNSTTAQVLAFYIELSGNFTNCLNYYFPMYQNFPKIQLSPQLTKVLISGPFIPPNQTQTQPKFDAFFINYPNKTFQNISLNLNLPADPASSFVHLDQKYLYTRSLLPPPNNTNATNGTNPNQPQENIYFLDQDVTPKLAKSTNLTQDQVSSWKRTIIVPGNNGVNIFVESVLLPANGTNGTNGTNGSNMGAQVVVNKVEVTPQQANLNSNSAGQGITGTVVDGKIKLCSPGCSDCSSGSCAGCQDGYAYDSTATSCVKCGQNCRACSSSNSAVCSSCIVGSYLSNSSTCLPCDRRCITCEMSATNCTGCPPGQSSINGVCGGCQPNCISCTNSTVCTACNRGFVVVNGSCRGCASSCSNCSATNITQCTSCAGGLTLVNSACVSCPDKCQSCNNGICTICIPGYNPNTAGKCVPKCQVSCATCVDNEPATCLSCYSGATLNGTTCQLSLTCNADSSCTDCGQGLGYVLVGSTCVQCSSISNCLQCDPTNTQQCSVCLNGYYINSSFLCAPCSASCNLCISADICTACVVGYTLADGQSQGQCLQCQSPCATCLGVATYCTSCVSGFTKKGWKCQNNTYVQFRFTLGGTPDNVLSSIDSITQGILRACGQNSTNVAAVTYDYIRNGSTDVSGSMTSSTSPVTAASGLSGLGTGSLGNFTVVSSSITVQGMSSDSAANTGLIAGLVVGFSVLIIIIVVIACVMYRRRKSPTQPLGSNEGEIVIELSNQDGSMLQPQQGGNASRGVQQQNNQESIAPQTEAHTWGKEVIDQ